MNKLFKIIIGSMITASGVAVIVFSCPLLIKPDWVSVGAFSLLCILGAMVAFSGVRIIRGENITKVSGELLRIISR